VRVAGSALTCLWMIQAVACVAVAPSGAGLHAAGGSAADEPCHEPVAPGESGGDAGCQRHCASVASALPSHETLLPTVSSTIVPFALAHAAGPSTGFHLAYERRALGELRLPALILRTRSIRI
jgi:hypothetical protein